MPLKRHKKAPRLRGILFLVCLLRFNFQPFERKNKAVWDCKAHYFFKTLETVARGTALAADNELINGEQLSALLAVGDIFGFLQFHLPFFVSHFLTTP